MGAIAGRDLINNAIKSVSLAAVLMLLYIAVRFDFYSGLAAIIGLLHDVAIMLSAVVLLHSFIRVETTFIAALLTIVGYSINNTIIIFDRIRENSHKSTLRQLDRESIVNLSVQESLSRTLNTTITTLLTIVTLYIMGVDSIKQFALPLIIGIVAGTYSANLINGYVGGADGQARREQAREGQGVINRAIQPAKSEDQPSGLAINANLRLSPSHEGERGFGMLRLTPKNQEKRQVPPELASLGLPDRLLELLLDRQIDTPEKIERYLHPKREDLHDPMLMQDMGKAVAVIRDAIEKHEEITVFGDYDVDGVTATAILLTYLRKQGAQVDFYIRTDTARDMA